MSVLYTVSFTTRVMIKKLDGLGKVISQTQMDKPVTMTALPYVTAMSYSQCDNFSMKLYEMDDSRPRATKSTGRDNSVGNGTKKVSRFNSIDRGSVNTVATNAKTDRSAIETAAVSGNMGAALNG